MTIWQAPDRKRNKGPWIALAIAVLVIVALAVTLLVIVAGRGETASTPPPPPAAASSPTGAAGTNDPGPGLVGAFTDLQYVQVGGVPIPTSPTLGPLSVNDDGTAGQFSHNQAGAVVAAVNLIARTSGLVPASVYEPTIGEQTVGDDATKQQTVTQAARDAAALASATTQYTTQVIGYRIDGLITADDVRMTLLSRATNADDPTMHALLQQGAEVRWQDGDWKYVLPPQEGAPVSAAPGGMAAFPGQTLTLSP